jgi:predicted dehydrogenase
MPRRLRWGMVGGGRGAFIGNIHRMAARLDDGYELLAGSLSSDPERARLSAEDCHIAPDRSYADFRDMAAKEAQRPDGTEVVSIVTPNHLHAEIARAFLERGIDVICDKPLATSLADAVALRDLATAKGKLLGVTYNYTGYPLVREARELVAQGAIGQVRLVQVEFLLGWLSVPLEAEGVKQAWRIDPAIAGPSGVVADIGTHALHLAKFVTGLIVDELAADIQTFVEKRKLEDNASVMLRYKGGARGHLWASMVAAGEPVGLRLRVYGETGSLAWDQSLPESLHFRPLDGSPRIIYRGHAASHAAKHGTRLVAGLPEGFVEGFANLYRDYAELLHAHIEKREPHATALLAPVAEDGVEGLAFVEAVLESNKQNGVWVKPAFSC